VILSRDNLAQLEEQLDYPMVLKIPDGSFSRGVFKVEQRHELNERAGRLFKSSDLILAQEYLYTDYDWRIGILDRKPVYACQYFMSKQHWQIYNHNASSRFKEGDSRTWAIEDAPQAVVATALKAANLIGDGLYGVDLKQTSRGVVVIEVNDNPNIETGVEDQILQGMLYRHVMETFARRLESEHR
jgi:glutathione synthase/RimK-type ligase-like ATP-grasp enzyme